MPRLKSLDKKKLLRRAVKCVCFALLFLMALQLCSMVLVLAAIRRRMLLWAPSSLAIWVSRIIRWM